MQVVAITGPRECTLKEVAEPAIKYPYVKIKIKAIPLCTEWKQWVDGKGGDALGHEAVGEVVQTSGASRLKVGTRVVVMPQNGCGVCELCTSGEHIHCETPLKPLEHCQSTTGRATYAQFCIQQDWLCLPIPDGVSWDHAALTLCGLGPTFNGMQQMNVSAFDTVLVSGLGAVGLGAVINARARGARVIALETNAYRSTLAKALGAEAIVNPMDPEALKQVKALTNGRGADTSIETSSAPTALEFLGNATRRKGSVACVGWSGGMPANLLVGRGLAVFGAWHWNHLRDAERMWRLVRSSSALLDTCITHRFPMSRVADAWQLQSTGECGKIVMDPWG